VVEKGGEYHCAGRRRGSAGVLIGVFYSTMAQPGAQVSSLLIHSGRIARPEIFTLIKMGSLGERPTDWIHRGASTSASKARRDLRIATSKNKIPRGRQRVLCISNAATKSQCKPSHITTATPLNPHYPESTPQPTP